MKDLDVFLPYVLPYAMGCPPSVAKQAVVDAAIEFCERSGAIQQTLDPMSTSLGTLEYELDLPTKQDLVQIKRAWFKGAEMTPVPTESVRNALAWRATIPGVQAQSGDPSEFYTASRNAVGIFPRPSVAETDVLTVRAVLKPSRDATQLDDALYLDWVEVIAAGALQRLHSTPAQPYTDSARAEQRAAKFFAGVTKAKLFAVNGRTQGELSVQMRPFA